MFAILWPKRQAGYPRRTSASTSNRSTVTLSPTTSLHQRRPPELYAWYGAVHRRSTSQSVRVKLDSSVGFREPYWVARGGRTPEKWKQMKVQIIPIALGFCQCYVLRADGVIAVDAGAPNKGSRFARAMERAAIPPEEVRLIVLTHGHWDHVGSAGRLGQMTGAKLALHEREIGWLEQGLTPLPPGITPGGRFFIRALKLFMPLIKVPPTKVDIALRDDGLSLTDYGIPGRVLYTPGHSSGSVSILLDSGEAFVGDLAMNRFPLRLSPGLPVLAEDSSAVIRSWRMLLEQGATTVYPAHGKPFPAEVIRSAIGA